MAPFFTCSKHDVTLSLRFWISVTSIAATLRLSCTAFRSLPSCLWCAISFCLFASKCLWASTCERSSCRENAFPGLSGSHIGHESCQHTFMWPGRQPFSPQNEQVYGKHPSTWLENDESTINARHHGHCDENMYSNMSYRPRWVLSRSCLIVECVSQFEHSRTGSITGSLSLKKTTWRLCVSTRSKKHWLQIVSAHAKHDGTGCKPSRESPHWEHAKVRFLWYVQALFSLMTERSNLKSDETYRYKCERQGGEETECISVIQEILGEIHANCKRDTKTKNGAGENTLSGG